MLRNSLRAGALIAALAGCVLYFLEGCAQAWRVAVWGSVLFVAIVIERWRYQHADQADHEAWQPTDEQFIDPETGRLTRVYYKPTSGERRYVVVHDEGSPS